MKLTIYDDATGRILMAMDVPGYEDAQDQIQPGQLILEGYFPPSDFYVENDEAVPMPARPADYFVFDFATKSWIDPRTPAEYDAYVQQVRTSASLSKTAFVHSLRQGGAFSNNDLIYLAVGYFPPSVYGMLSSLTPNEVLDIQLAWISAPMVGRMDKIVLHVAAAMGTSDADLDSLFGIVLDPPPPAG